MADTQGITEFDLSLLPGWDEELKCESKHADWRSPVCTVSATHLGFTCVGSRVPICEATVRFYRAAIQSNGTCDRCSEPASTHWRVVPV